MNEELSPMELASKYHHHSPILAEPINRTNNTYCHTCRDWYLPLRPVDRVFCGVFPGGISWADRSVEQHGDYKALAFLPYGSLVLEIRPGCPSDLLAYIEPWANDIIARRGQSFQTSTCGQSVILGSV